MALAWANLWGRKTRRARRGAQVAIKEARVLLRRGKNSVPPHHQETVQAALDATQSALKGSDVSAIEQASGHLCTHMDLQLAHLRRPAWRESVESIGFAILVALTIRCFVFEVFQIPSGSMIPTLAIGDKILVNKFVYGLRVPFTSVRLVEFASPERGEVVVFIAPMPPHEDYIKRIVAIPGDEIEVRGGTIYINRRPIQRAPIADGTFWDRDLANEMWRPFTAKAFHETMGPHEFTVLQEIESTRNAEDFPATLVPQGHVFCMGDNRDHSYDSRKWGLVPTSNILGRSMFVLWSWGKDGIDMHRAGNWIQ